MSAEKKVLPIPVDEFHGVGGEYEIDENGKRRLVKKAETPKVSEQQPTEE